MALPPGPRLQHELPHTGDHHLEKQMDEDQEALTKYGIRCEEQKIYRYKTYRYARLSDAINYAKMDLASAQALEPVAASTALPG